VQKSTSRSAVLGSEVNDRRIRARGWKPEPVVSWIQGLLKLWVPFVTLDFSSTSLDTVF